MIKVLIVDDHEILRTGIRKLLQEITDFEIVGEACTGEEAVELARTQSPNLVLMDIKMPGIGGMEATRRILTINPNIKVIGLTACEEEPFPTRMLQAGASGYVTKGSGLDEVLLAIRKVLGGQQYVSPEIAQILALKNLQEAEGSPFEQLSARELQILLMITNGQNIKEISKKLNLSTKTIHTYRYRILQKLKVENDVELTHLALRHGVIERSKE
jgi:two-component system invasion response regulator UvrY